MKCFFQEVMFANTSTRKNRISHWCEVKEVYFDKNLMAVLSEYTTEKMTRIFYKKGLIDNGVVTEINKSIKNITLMSNIFEINLKFSQNCLNTRYSKLLLKVCKVQLNIGNMIPEVFFCDQIAGHMKNPPVPYYIDAVYYEKYDMYCILMEDLDDTHVSLQEGYPLLPKKEQCYQVVQALAHFHAHWWNSESLVKFETTYVSQGIYDKKFIYQIYQKFCEEFKNLIDATFRKNYEMIFQSFDEIVIGNNKNRTIVHNDFHFGNVLYPKKEGQIIFIDWADWKVGNPILDLAYMFALRYFPRQRNYMEEKMLHAYHDVLADYQINYSFEELETDYRNAKLKCALIPLFQWRYQLPSEIWYYNLERVLEVFE